MVTLEAWARKEQLIHETQKTGAKNKRTAASGVNWKQVLSSSHQHHELGLAQVPSNTGKAAQEQREGASGKSRLTTAKRILGLSVEEPAQPCGLEITRNWMV